MKNDTYNLDRFIEAQEKDYSIAVQEMKNGLKVNHWIWYTFPQIVDLGRSAIDRKFSIKSKAEVKAYYKHPILGKRLLELCIILLELNGKSALSIFGHPDYLKVWSSITLFRLIIKEEVIFEQVLEKYYSSRLDDKTLSILSTL